MCIRDRYQRRVHGEQNFKKYYFFISFKIVMIKIFAILFAFVILTTCQEIEGEYGIDVSWYQNTIDWSKIKTEANKTFAFIRATRNDSYYDPNYTYNKEEAKKNGIKTGAYHFFFPNIDPIIQAQHFIKHGGCHEHELPPVLDVEQTSGMDIETIQTTALKWLAYVEEKCQVKPLVYSYYNFIVQNLQNDEFAKYPLWMAYWHEPFKFPGPWRQWQYWQYSSTGNISGITGDVDLDRKNGFF
eukprot:TRINITY_DN488_c0_g1_i1.p1 TRINITY_DN488_c0_g1~~TRINITY_DN488_c0_g1_i1.p1  ORF type:complete len:242 (-),score=97.44 TRINITY_DN488_c0_g1_i1:104-829(-)